MPPKSASASAPAPASAILAAAGSGERLGAGVPKAFVEAGGRTLLEWCLRALRAAEAIGPIVVAMPPGEPGSPGAGRITPDIEALLDPRKGGEGVRTVPGGASRSESVRAALELVETEDVVVHDAARPLAEPALFDAVVAKLRDEECDAVVAAAPVSDTIKEVLRRHEVSHTLDRSALWAAQTPQAFRTETLRRALGETGALAQATDDAMLVERMRGRIRGRVLVHPAPAENLKVTSPLDLRVAEMLLAERG